MGNIYEAVLVEKGNSDEKKLWILAISFQNAAAKAEDWISKEEKKSGIRWQIDKLEYEGSIDIS